MLKSFEQALCYHGYIVIVKPMKIVAEEHRLITRY